MEKLIKSWKIFFSIVLDAWTFVLIFSVFCLILFSIGQTNATVTSLLLVLITIASAILGGRITKHWADITEGGVVVARGKSAVRSLKLLLGNISALEQRVAAFSNSHEDIKSHPEVTKRNYEEIQKTCNILQEEAVSSIENWTDIVPEADIKTQIGVISKLKQFLEDKEEELTSLNMKLDSTKGKSDEDKKKLEAEVKKKTEQISTLEREIIEKKIGLGGLLGQFGGLNMSSTGRTNSILSGFVDVSGRSNLDLGSTKKSL